MGRFAENTTVSVEKSRAEIERILERYGASQFMYGRDDLRGLATIQFQASDRQVRFILSLPNKSEDRFWKHSRGRRTPDAAEKQWEQSCRQSWRALALCIKAKLEAVESGISEFEDEFMAHIVIPSGGTVGELMRPQIEAAYELGSVPSGLAGFLPAPNESE
ncbi:hypothetical protein KOR42_23700 [Thalassoglobus neptunius]|uniref:Uncharacterized protein n=1 Tax=Thalassoglobus neptunius TaxID=1938619 RepID=A0A5C5X9J1_9PLAN|nr:hypothetical protein [Thalassoglobus neptunius]TWT58983.1 hypothetical protein KOR42_23700 [Thalassoglobus neptunius]